MLNKQLTVAAALLTLSGVGVTAWSLKGYLDDVEQASAPAPTPTTTFSVQPSAPAQHLWDQQSAVTTPAVAQTELSRQKVAQDADPNRCYDPKTFKPNRVYIPRLCMDAPLVTTTSVNGSMEIPSNPIEVAWLDTTAPLKSKVGSTLIAGHVDYEGVYGSLSGLASSQPGMRVYVTDSAGRPTKWVVVSLNEYHKSSSLPKSLFSTQGEKRLAIVTCGGPLEQSTDGRRSYRDNVVVTALPIS